MHHKVMCPHEQDKDVDRQDPQHQEKDRVCKIGEIIMSRRFLGLLAKASQQCEYAYRLFRMPLSSHASSELHDARHHIGKLIRDSSRNKNQQNSGVNQPSSGRRGRKDGKVADMVSIVHAK